MPKPKEYPVFDLIREGKELPENVRLVLVPYNEYENLKHSVDTWKRMAKTALRLLEEEKSKNIGDSK